MLTTSFFRSQITISASMMQFLTFALNRDETRSAWDPANSGPEGEYAFVWSYPLRLKYLNESRVCSTSQRTKGQIKSYCT
jgi:hypothetical protein